MMNWPEQRAIRTAHLPLVRVELVGSDI